MRLIIVTTGLTLLAACEDPLGARLDVWVPDPSSILADEQYSGLDAATRLVVQDVAAWHAVWQNVYPGSPPLPAIDFETQTVLVAGFGLRPTGGFVITIDSLVRYSGGSIVHVTEWSPGAGCVVIDSETAPAYVVVTAERVVAPDWRTARRLFDCL